MTQLQMSNFKCQTSNYFKRFLNGWQCVTRREGIDIYTYRRMLYVDYWAQNTSIIRKAWHVYHPYCANIFSLLAMLWLLASVRKDCHVQKSMLVWYIGKSTHDFKNGILKNWLNWSQNWKTNQKSILGGNIRWNFLIIPSSIPHL